MQYRTTIILDRQTATEAKTLGLNISAICRQAVARAVNDKNAATLKNHPLPERAEFGRAALPRSVGRPGRPVSNISLSDPSHPLNALIFPSLLNLRDCSPAVHR